LSGLISALERRRLGASAPGRGWQRVTGWKAIAAGLVVTPLVLAAVMLGADALGLRGGESHAPAPAASQPAGGNPGGSAHAGHEGRPHGSATTVPTGGSSSSTTTAQSSSTISSTAPARAGASPAASALPSPARHGGNPATASGTSGGTRPTGSGSGGAATSTTFAGPATTTTASTTAPSSPTAIWRAQGGSWFVTLHDDVAAVAAAAPTPDGDYTAVAPLWEQLAADVAAAEGVAAIPDAAIDATWSAALGELGTATTDWMASLTSISPPGGTIVDQATFDAGTAQFDQGVSDLMTAAAAVAAA
jgi:hypothetical protein